MGKWNGYHLAVGTGDRDPESVAANLRIELQRVAPDLYEYAESAYRNRDRSSVWHEGDVVRWTTGESHSYGAEIIDLWYDDAVTEFDVPGEWALGVWQQEVEWWGGAALFARLDDRYVKIDQVTGRYGRGTADAIAYFEREWGVEGRQVDDLPSQDSEAATSTHEGATASAEGVDSVASVSATELVGGLETADPGERRAIVERLFVAVERDAVSFARLPIPVLDALDDPETKFAAAATVRELDVPPGEVRETLRSGSPARRRSAARYFACRNWSDEETTQALSDALSDADADVRAAAANALRRRTERHGSRGESDAPPAPVEAISDLLEVARDEDPRVRADATLAAAQLAFYHDADDRADAAAEALVAAITDSDEDVRGDAVRFCDVEHEDLPERAPDDALTRFVASLGNADDANEGFPTGVTNVGWYVARYRSELVEPILDELVERGWHTEPRSAFAREMVTTMAKSAADDFPTTTPSDLVSVADALVEAAEDDVCVEEAIDVLEVIVGLDDAEVDAEALDRLSESD